MHYFIYISVCGHQDFCKLDGTTMFKIRFWDFGLRIHLGKWIHVLLLTPHVLLDCWKYVDGFWRLVEMLLSHLTSDVLIAHFSPAAFTIYCVVESPEMSATVVFSKLSSGQETQTHSGSRCIVWGWKLNKTMWRRKDDIQPWCQWVFISAAAFKMKE